MSSHSEKEYAHFGGSMSNYNGNTNIYKMVPTQKLGRTNFATPASISEKQKSNRNAHLTHYSLGNLRRHFLSSASKPVS